MTRPAPGAVPRTYRVDHHDPEAFVIRCTACGRLAIDEDRAHAHDRADSHALRCRPTGVTPVSKQSDATTDAQEPSQEPSAPATTGGLSVFEDDLTDERISVRYESVSDHSGEREVIGDVVDMVSADEEPVEYRGVIIRLPSRKRRRVDLLDELVECPHNSERGWRLIGDLLGIGPASAAGNPPVVMTDGGVTLDGEDDT